MRPTYKRSSWDTTIRATGIVGLISIPVSLQFPDAGPLIGFALVTVWVNGPISFLFPAVYEPVLIGIGSVYPPILIAGLGVAAIVFVEFLNYYLYKHFVASSRIASHRVGLRIVHWFNRAPFFTVLLCSSVLPYWPLRFVAPVSGYPVDRYLLATGLGRFPRLWFFAALGSMLRINPVWLFAIASIGITIALVRWVWRRHDKQT